MFDKIIIAVLATGLAGLLFSFPVAFLSQQKKEGIEHVMKVCEETGMYLTEGKAMTCRVLKNQGG